MYRKLVMKYNIPKLLILYLVPIPLFIIDICTFFWFQAPLSFLLFSFLLCASWYRFIPALILTGSLLLIAQSLVINQGFTPPLFIQLALIALLIICRERLYLTGAIPPLAFTAYFTLFYPFGPYTIEAIFVNLTAIGIFSLKLKTSKTRQSLMPIA